MLMNPKNFVVALLGAALLPVGPAAAAECKLQKIAELPVTMKGLRGTVATQVNGHDAAFTVDTGAFFSSIDSEEAAQFGMKKPSTPFGLDIRAAGGAARDAQAVSADSFTFAGAGFKNIQFL